MTSHLEIICTRRPSWGKTYPIFMVAFLRHPKDFQYAVISVGAGNTYGHPTEDTLNCLRDADTKVFRTDLQGDIPPAKNAGNITAPKIRSKVLPAPVFSYTVLVFWPYFGTSPLSHTGIPPPPKNNFSSKTIAVYWKTATKKRGRIHLPRP